MLPALATYVLEFVGACGVLGPPLNASLEFHPSGWAGKSFTRSKVGNPWHTCQCVTHRHFAWHVHIAVDGRGTARGLILVASVQPQPFPTVHLEVCVHLLSETSWDSANSGTAACSLPTSCCRRKGPS